MHYRLQRNAKRELKSRYSRNTIYRVLKAPCQKHEAESKSFYLSAEEVFYECICALDVIREEPAEAVFNFQDFWSEKYNEYRELTSEVSAENEIATAASLVVLSVVVCLNVSSVQLYNTLTLSMVRQLKEHDPSYLTIQEELLANIHRLGDEKFTKSVVEYLKGDDFLSDEIEEVLDEVPEEEPASWEENVNAEKLTTNQLIVFFDVILDIGFTPETTNVSAYSKLIGLIAGKPQESIRTSINRWVKRGYEDKTTKKDVAYLASLLEPVKIEYAQKMRNQIINED